MNRRRFLTGAAVAGTTALAGCTGSLGGLLGPEFGAASDPWSNQNDSNTTTSYTDRGTVTLPENKYASLTYNTTRTVRFTVEASSENPFDVYTLDSTEFGRYRDSEEFQINNLSAENTTHPQFSGRLAGGTWYIVFDNTDIGTTYDGEISARYGVQQSVI